MTTDSPTGTDLVFAQASLRDRMEWARAIAAAGDLVPAGFRNRDGTPNAAKILLAAETGAMLGLHPVAALNGIHVIEGKPTLSAGLMSALVRRAGHRLRVTTKGDVGKGTFEATATLIRYDDPDFTYTATWNADRAKRANLTGKGSWGKYFESMAKARAISEVIREGAEDVLMGAAYTSEEIGGVMTDSGELIREDLIEDAEIVEPDQDPGHNGPRGVANETDGSGRSNAQTTPTADTRPRSSRTKAEPGAGRTVPSVGSGPGEVIPGYNAPDQRADDQHAIADEWAYRASRALTVTDARDLYRDAKHRGILDYPTTGGELLEDILRARGEHLADEENQAAAGEPADEEVPLDLPY